mmetsp:Transcript_53228/g.161679  ORF Transcript_53228/g.161679 Transcript_53228/m.161679 type:complete len:236 (+) Transcript_53228:679-1386(+)
MMPSPVPPVAASSTTRRTRHPYRGVESTTSALIRSPILTSESAAAWEDQSSKCGSKVRCTVTVGPGTTASTRAVTCCLALTAGPWLWLWTRPMTEPQNVATRPPPEACEPFGGARTLSTLACTRKPALRASFGKGASLRHGGAFNVQRTVPVPALWTATCRIRPGTASAAEPANSAFFNKPVRPGTPKSNLKTCSSSSRTAAGSHMCWHTAPASSPALAREGRNDNSTRCRLPTS